MNIINVAKTYTSETSGYFSVTQWPIMMEEIFIPLFSNFNNITYIGKNAVMNPSQYMFSINGAENVFLQMSLGANANTPSIRISFCSSNDITASNTSWIGQYTINPSGRISTIPITNTNVNSRYVEFKFCYIKDNNNNLKAWWVVIPAYSAKDAPFPHVLTTTATNELIGIDFAEGTRGINAFYLNDENLVNYFIPHYTQNYSSDLTLLKSSYVPVVSGGAASTSVKDAIVNNEFVYIFNLNENIYCTGNNNSIFNKKLVKIGDTYYRQLVDELWIRDWDGENIITNITD